MSNVICMQEYRSRRFPSPEEVSEDLEWTINNSENQEEVQISEALLELYRSGMIRAQRTRDGEFLYSLKDEEQD